MADSSQVQGELIASKPAPEVNSEPWLLLQAKVGTAANRLANIKFIRRTETHGGVAPESGCQSSRDANKIVRIPYTSTYTFYAEKWFGDAPENACSLDQSLNRSTWNYELEEQLVVLVWFQNR